MSIGKYQKTFGVGPLGMLISIMMFFLLWLLDRALNHVRILIQPKPIRIVGLVLIVLWACWHAWSIQTISRWWRHGILCTKGPYKFVRHPIYAGGILLGSVGVALIFNSWILLSLPILMHATFSILVRKEETMMDAVFGEEYRAYTARTGKLFPRMPLAK